MTIDAFVVDDNYEGQMNVIVFTIVVKLDVFDATKQQTMQRVSANQTILITRERLSQWRTIHSECMITKDRNRTIVEDVILNKQI